MGEAAWKLDVEPRRDRRANVYLSVEVFSGSNFWTGLTMDMSEGGLFIATENALPAVGSMVVMNFVLPLDDEKIVALAEVRWTRRYPSQDGGAPGIGLQFVDLSDAVREKIRECVSTVCDPLVFPM